MLHCTVNFRPQYSTICIGHTELFQAVWQSYVQPTSGCLRKAIEQFTHMISEHHYVNVYMQV